MSKGDERTSAKKKITELDAAWGKAASAKELDATVRFYAPHGTLVWPEMEAVHGTADIRKAWKEMLEMPGLGLKFSPERIDIGESGDLAIDFGQVEFKHDDDSGRNVTEIAKYLVVWKQVDGEWKVLYDSWNTNKASTDQ